MAKMLVKGNSALSGGRIMYNTKKRKYQIQVRVLNKNRWRTTSRYNCPSMTEVRSAKAASARG